MQKVIGHFRAIVSRILFIGVSVQILLGLLWMLFALDGRQDFVGSVYADLLDSLLSGFFYEPIIYLLQLGVAFAAGYQLIEALGAERPFWKIWGSLALLTYPYALQCHMAILPDSLAFSCFLLLLSAGLKKKKSIYLYWILSAVFLPEYFYFGLVSITVCFFVAVKNTNSLKKKWTEVLVFAVVIVLAMCMQKEIGTVKEGNLEAAWFRRTAWSSMSHFYSQWPEAVTNAITDEEYEAIKLRPENVERILQPKVENILGEESAGKWFVTFGTFVLKENGQQIIRDVAKDAGGYLFPNVFVQLRLEGRGGSSYCNRNYEIMRQGHPFLTRCYIQYASWWFVIGIFGVVLMLLARPSDKDPVQVNRCCAEKNRWWILGVGLASGLLMIVWYTFWTSGLWDPKKALFVGCIWMLWMLRNAAGCFEKK